MTLFECQGFKDELFRELGKDKFKWRFVPKMVSDGYKLLVYKRRRLDPKDIGETELDDFLMELGRDQAIFVLCNLDMFVSTSKGEIRL